MKRLLLAALLCAAPVLARAQSAAPGAYKTPSGQYPATVATTPVSSGSAMVGAYKGQDGQWHAPLVTVNLCSVDANGFPLLCPASVPLAGGTMTGDLTVPGFTIGSNTASGAPFTYNTAAGNYRAMLFQSAGVQRWAFGVDSGTESGSNAGSNMFIARYADNGSVIDLPLQFNRATGAATFADGAAIIGPLIIPFGTPASSSAPCTKGQIEADVTYSYTCIAANSWHRLNNGASW